MPIELWWWVGPLFFTGFLVAIICILVGYILERIWPGNIATVIIAVVGILPWAVCAVSILVWLIANILIIIWRC